MRRRDIGYSVNVSRDLAALREWIPFAARTMAYGMASCVGGPLTGGAFSQLCMRHWCRRSLAGFGIRVQRRGAMPSAPGPTVIVSNHSSLLDILVLGAVLDVDYEWAAKRELFRVPFIGWHLALAGHIPVDRGNRRALGALERNFARALRSGKNLLIFPEGTRSPDGRMQAFKIGAFLAAVHNGVPVVPIVLDGTAELLEKGSWRLKTTSQRLVRLRVLDPISAPQEGGPNARAAALRTLARTRMAGALDELRQGD